jgi:hypothetical protein
MRLLELFGAFLRDQPVDPFEIVLGGCGPVLEERPGVAVDRAVSGLALAGQTLGQLGPAPFEKGEPSGRIEVAAERELQGEGPFVVVALVGEELGEERPAGFGDAVGLAGPATRAGSGPAHASGGEIALERAGRDKTAGRSVGGVALVFDFLDRTLALEALEGGIERAERDAPEGPHRVAQTRLQLVAMTRLLGEHPEDGQFQHVLHDISIRYIESSHTLA